MQLVCLHTWSPDSSAVGNVTGLSDGKASVGEISRGGAFEGLQSGLTVLSPLPVCKRDLISQLPAPVLCFPCLLPCPSYHNGLEL